MKEISEDNQEEALPRCEQSKVSDKLVHIIQELHEKLNGNSSEYKICIIIEFYKKPRRLFREQRSNLRGIIKDYNPKTIHYLENKFLEHFPLGSTGNLVAEIKLSELDNIRKIDEIKNLDYTSYRLKEYYELFKLVNH